LARAGKEKRSFMYLYGKNSVLERIKHDPRSIRRIYLQDNFSVQHINRAIQNEKIQTVVLPEKKFLQVKRADRMQGIVAEVDKFHYVGFKELLSRAMKNDLTMVFLDSVSDPHNVGSIMRTLACLGKFAMVIPEHNACDINETVLHVASGGENFVLVSKVTNLSTALIAAKKQGFWAVGSAIDGGEDVTETDFAFPLCLVLGSEGKGIRPGLQKQLEVRVRIPMSGAPLSFNVTTACAILCHEIEKQRSK